MVTITPAAAAALRKMKEEEDPTNARAIRLAAFGAG